MHLFLTALKFFSDVEPSYKLSGVGLILFFFVARSLLANDSLIAVLDRALNVRLKNTHLFEILRLALLIIAIFCCLFITLAFASPLFIHYLDKQKVEVAVSALTDLPAAYERAQEQLKAHNYLNARDIYLASLQQAPDEATAEQIRGMVTATYYGQGLHQEGLEYICSLYLGRAPSDRRYLFAVQAHLRAIGIRDGRENAEKIAQSFRKKCQRQDFSEFWANIPFGMMEELRSGTLRVDHNYVLSNEDRRRLRYWVEKKTKRSADGTIPLGDYALYFLGDFDRALKFYPNSYIRAEILLDAGYLSKWPASRQYFEQFLSEFPRDVRRPSVELTLVSLSDENGRRDLALNYVSRLSNDTISSAMAILESTTTEYANKFAATGDFNSALQTVTNACEQILAHDLDCSNLASLKSKLEWILRARSSNPLLCRELVWRARAAHFVRGARSYLAKCLDQALDDKLEYGRDLYLLASMSRQLGEYDQSLEYLKKFARELPDSHPLMDDVYAEMGWHYLKVTKNTQTAKKYFDVVISKFPTRNAYDDALWWRAQLAVENNHYHDAVFYYTEIATLRATSRFKDWSEKNLGGLRSLQKIAPVRDASFYISSDDPDYISVARVPVDSPPYKLGIRDEDRLVELCGKAIHQLQDLLDAAQTLEESTAVKPCSIEFQRDDLRFAFAGSGPRPADWKSVDPEYGGSRHD